MKSFDVYLQRAQVSKWKSHYINYASLKERLKLFGKRRRKLQRGNLEWSTVLETQDKSNNNNNDTGGTDSDTDNNIVFGYTLQDLSQDGEGGGVFGHESKEDRLSQLEHDDFKKTLQSELDQASKWFQSCWMEFQSASFENNEREEEDSILDLYGFAVVNICVLRQSILKFNAHARMYDGSMFLSEWEISQQPSPHSLFSSSAGMISESEAEDASIDYSIKTVLPSLLASLDPLQDRMMTMPSYWMMSDSPEVENIRKGSVENSDFRARADDLESLLELTSWKQQTRQSPNTTERLLRTIRSFYTIGTAQMGISMEPKFLHAQVRGFKKEMKSLAVWRERPLGAATPGDEDGSSLTGAMDPANVWPLVLNLISCYLFMMNNYIIEPSSAYYANALGSSDAMSGIMMGMAPWFALLSAVGYSVWTNTSYKQPILFAGTLMVIGNTLYGAAYSYESMTMCLVGRAISGFGAPRIINRRYVADATPFSLRTMSSAAFALTTALGAASGPGFAILLDMIPEFQFNLPILGVQTFNGMTGPGFVMALLWFLFTITILISFREPNRSGLDELKQREAAASANSSAHEALYPAESFADEDGAGATTDDDDASSVGSLSVGSYVNDDAVVSKHSPLYCIKHMTRATALCMGLIFMKRIALEVRNPTQTVTNDAWLLSSKLCYFFLDTLSSIFCLLFQLNPQSIVGSTSVITKNRYAWSIRNVGLLHLVNGLIVIPVSIFAGWLSQYKEDRYLAMWFMAITSLGLLIMIDLTDLFDVESSETYNYDSAFAVGPVQYILGSLIAFSGVEACESFVASLMSKCVPSALAVGTFNSGLLATLVGTGGRAVGDLFITAMGLISIRNLLNQLIIPGLCLMLLSMFLLWKNYKILAV
jgi:hypothetical protein